LLVFLHPNLWLLEVEVFIQMVKAASELLGALPTESALRITFPTR